MRKLTKQEMAQVEGGDFWGGFTCGVALAVAASEGFINPIADLLALGTCGWAFE
jgi:bacteriocin-like protein